MESYRDKRLKRKSKKCFKKKDCGSIRIEEEEEERRGIGMILFSLKRKEKNIYMYRG